MAEEIVAPQIGYVGKLDPTLIQKLWKGWKKVKYEREVDFNFVDQVRAMPGCHNIDECIQCGTCSGTCPVGSFMEYAPRKIIGMVRAGFKSEVLSSYTTWICASCYACTVECPKQIKITDVMYALKQIAIREGYHPRKMPIPALATEFSRIVYNHGRNNEGMVIMRMYFKTNPLLPLRNLLFGFKLYTRGRIHFIQDRIKNVSQFQNILNAVKLSQREGHFSNKAPAVA